MLLCVLPLRVPCESTSRHSGQEQDDEGEKKKSGSDEVEARWRLLRDRLMEAWKKENDDENGVGGSFGACLEEYAAFLLQREDEEEVLEEACMNMSSLLLWRWKTALPAENNNKKKKKDENDHSKTTLSRLREKTTTSLFLLQQKYQQQQQQQQQQASTEASTEETSSNSSLLTSERCNVLYNLAVLETTKAATSTTSTTSSNHRDDEEEPEGWQSALIHLERAASLVGYLRDMLSSSSHSSEEEVVFTMSFLELWQALIVAEAQQAAYWVVAQERSSPEKNQQLVECARLAAAAVPLYQDVQDLCQSFFQQTPKENVDHAVNADRDEDEEDQESDEEEDEQDMDDEDDEGHPHDETVVGQWGHVARAWVMCMSALAHSHQASSSSVTQLSSSSEVAAWKKAAQMEVARLTVASKFALLCERFQETFQEQEDDDDENDDGGENGGGNSVFLTQLPQLMTRTVMDEMDERMLLLQEQLDAMESADEGKNEEEDELDPEDVPDVEPQAAVRMQSIQHVLQQITTKTTTTTTTPGRNNKHPPMQPQEQAPPVLDPAVVQGYTDRFQREMVLQLEELVSLSRSKMDLARKSLAMVHLPHSLAAYREEREQQRLPLHLWEQIDLLQTERQVTNICNDAFMLRETVANHAHHLCLQIRNVLDRDLQTDEEYRNEYPDFEGYDVPQLQMTFRKHLQNLEQLLHKARHDGDDMLFHRCQAMEHDPKLRLLLCSQAELDQLVRQQNQYQNSQQLGSRSGGGGGGGGALVVEVEVLSQLLVDLSVLFDERENLLRQCRQAVLVDYPIQKRLSEFMLQKQQTKSSSPTLLHHGNDNDDDDEIFRKIVQEGYRILDSFSEKLSVNVNEQESLVRRIQYENDLFVRAKQQQQQSEESSPGILQDVTDALEEFESLSKHIKEGRAFYDVILPKLNKLLDRVEMASQRLSDARESYQQGLQQQEQQEEYHHYHHHPRDQDHHRGDHEDAYASNHNHYGGGGHDDPRYFGNGNYDRHSGGGGGIETNNYERHSSGGGMTMTAPLGFGGGGGIAPTTNNNNHVDRGSVNDAHVAHLVSMGFDSGSVVEALRCHANDFERALNQLLS